MKCKGRCPLVPKFCHRRIMTRRHSFKRTCTLMIIYAFILVTVFMIGDKYGLNCYDLQKNTEKIHKPEEIYSKLLQTKHYANMESHTVKTTTQHNDNGLPVQTHRRIVVYSDIERVQTPSSNRGRVQQLSSGIGRVQSVRNQSVITKQPLPSAKEVEKILARVQSWFTIKSESEKDTLLNKHQFTFHLNSKLCASHVDILIFVHSASQNIKRREEIRKTWGSVKHRNLSIVTVFMLGESDNILVNQNLTTESVTHGDIVKGNFLDSYRNLTYKHVMALHWITSQCNDVRTVVKVDDDILIDIYKLINFSISTGHVHNTLYCSYFYRGYPIHDVRDKWYTPRELYPFKVYPTYCEGLAYILSADEVTKMYKASEDTRFYWVDDVYVTGILARKSGIGHMHFEQKHSYTKKNRRSNTGPIIRDGMFYLDFDDWTDIWSRIQMKRNIVE